MCIRDSIKTTTERRRWVADRGELGDDFENKAFENVATHTEIQNRFVKTNMKFIYTYIWREKGKEEFAVFVFL